MDLPYDQVHALRFKLSLEWLKHKMPEKASVLEVGGGGCFTPLLKAQHPDAELAETRGSLHEWQPRDQYDMVLLMEVYEHINDVFPKGKEAHEWAGSGAATLLEKLWFATKPGGWVFLTTPNAASHLAMQRIIDGGSGFIYRPHVREYTMEEVILALQTAGFRVNDAEALYSWSKYRPLIRGTYPHRGDNLFVLAQKPS